MHELVVEPGAAIAITDAGESAPVDNMQPYLPIGFYICINGEFPPRE